MNTISVSLNFELTAKQDHDYLLFKKVHDLAVADQDNLPPSLYPALHLTNAEAKSFRTEECGELFSNHTLVIKPPISSGTVAPSIFHDEDGNITFKYVMDEDLVVEVHGG